MASTGQKEQQARREEWWRRFSWAIGLLAEEQEVQREVGIKVIIRLSQSLLAGSDELAIVKQASGAANRRAGAQKAVLDRKEPDELEEG